MTGFAIFKEFFSEGDCSGGVGFTFSENKGPIGLLLEPTFEDKGSLLSEVRDVDADEILLIEATERDWFLLIEEREV